MDDCYYRSLPRPMFPPLCALCGSTVFWNQSLVTTRRGSYAHESCAEDHGMVEWESAAALSDEEPTDDR